MKTISIVDHSECILHRKNASDTLDKEICFNFTDTSNELALNFASIIGTFKVVRYLRKLLTKITIWVDHLCYQLLVNALTNFMCIAGGTVNNLAFLNNYFLNMDVEMWLGRKFHAFRTPGRLKIDYCDISPVAGYEINIQLMAIGSAMAYVLPCIQLLETVFLCQRILLVSHQSLLGDTINMVGCYFSDILVETIRRLMQPALCLMYLGTL